MQKKTLILSIIIGLTLTIFIFFYFRFLVQPKYFTDITELYSSFTDPMKAEVGSYLQSLACEPKEYYYDNSNLCFVCGDIHTCFGYVWVDRREEGMKRNSKYIPYIAGIEEFNVKVADFCKAGLASEFNCQKINENSLECEQIKFIATYEGGIFKCEEVRLMLKEEAELKNFANDFCRLREEEIREATESFASCGRYRIGIRENREIRIGIKLGEE